MVADDQSLSKTPVTAKWIVRRMLRRHRKYISLTAMVGVIEIGTQSLITIAIGLIVDHAVIAGDLTRLIFGLLVLVALNIIFAITWQLVIGISITSSQNEVYLLRREIVERVLDPRGERNASKTGDSLAAAISDAHQAAEIARLSGSFVSAITNFGVLLTILLVMDPWLGMGSLLGSVSVVVILHGLTAAKISQQHVKSQTANARTAALATDLIAGIRVLRGIGGSNAASLRYRQFSQNTLRTKLKLTKINAHYESTLVALSGIFLAVVVGIAGWRTLTGLLSIGELIIVVAVAAELSRAVQGLGSYGQLFASSWGAAVRVATALSTSPMVNYGTSVAEEALIDEKKVCLTLEEVSYRTLTNVNMSIYSGELLGIFSFDPIDTDAFLALLAHEVPWADYRGKILINGTPTDGLSINTIRRAILVEQHNTVLFEGTVRTNLFSRRTKESEERALRALSAAAATELIKSSPAGLDHVVSDRGATFSGGQRQRIGLARALCVNPPILVLPEPTTAIDAVTEEIVADGLVKFRHGEREADAVSTVIFTNSSILLSRTHRVIVVDAGTIIDSDTHIALMERNSRYRQAVLR